MKAGVSRRELVRRRLEAEDMQKRWFTIVAVLTKEAGELRISARSIRAVPKDAELEVRDDGGDLVVTFVEDV